MKADKSKLKRLKRLEKLRTIAKRDAAAETARAEGTLAQLQSLAGRSRAIAEGYGEHRALRDGGDLRSMTAFVAGVRTIAAATASDAEKARKTADRKMAELAVAERRRSVVEERADATFRSISRRGEPLAHGARPRIGTGLE